MMYLVIGRTGSGKTHLANLLEKQGLSRVVSRTTRPRRSEDEDGYIFVTHEEADATPERLTDTVINGETYYTVPEDLKDKDFYVIDPIGARKLAEAMPDETFVILYLAANGTDIRREHALSREDSYDEATFAARDASEDDEFEEFENQILDAEDMSAIDLPDNVHALRVIANDYKPGTLENEAAAAAVQMRRVRRLGKLVTEGASPDVGIMMSNTDGRIYVAKRDGSEAWCMPDTVALMLLADPEGFYRFMSTMLVRSKTFADL